VNFTREPIIETVITPKEGYKLVVRNSKGGSQEEFFVDAVEVISFGSCLFYRSLEKPKCFLVPVNDYEILEVREARMVLKSTSLEKGVKIGGGRESAQRVREKEVELPIPPPVMAGEEAPAMATSEQKLDKKRERRRFRKKKGKLEGEGEGEAEEQHPQEKPQMREIKPSSLIPPPSTLISETLGRRRESVSLEEEIVREETFSDEGELEPPQEQSSDDEHIPF